MKCLSSGKEESPVVDGSGPRKSENRQAATYCAIFFRDNLTVDKSDETFICPSLI